MFEIFLCCYYPEENTGYSDSEIEMLQKVDLYCYNKDLKWRYLSSGNLLFIFSNISTWRLEFHGPNIVLYHKNTRQHFKNNRYYSDFHKQGKSYTDIKDAIYYIASHDKDKYLREYRREQNSPVSRAFQIIEQKLS